MSCFNASLIIWSFEIIVLVPLSLLNPLIVFLLESLGVSPKGISVIPIIFTLVSVAKLLRKSKTVFLKGLILFSKAIIGLGSTILSNIFTLHLQKPLILSLIIPTSRSEISPKG